MPAMPGGKSEPTPSDVWANRIELIATIVMAAAAILTAWAAFQSAKWSGIQAIEFSKASASRIESTRFDTRAGQLTTIDVSVFLAWLEAVNDEIRNEEIVLEPGTGYQPTPGTLSAFQYERMREEFRPAFDAWIDSRPLTNPDAPPTPFALPEYVVADSVAADAALDQAAGHTDAALVANQNSDNHVLVVVALALAIFFGGVSSKLDITRNRLIAISMAVVIFTGASMTLAFLPKVNPF
jgi:hypothetical protein